MARIAWAELCEQAFLDGAGRLCLIGITQRLPIPSLPVTVYQLMISAHVVDVQVGDELSVEVWITTPRGVSAAPKHPNSLSVGVAAEYLLLTLRDVPLVEEGVYRMAVVID